MKRTATIILLFSMAIMTAQEIQKPTVDVSGEGTVHIVPDEVTIRIRVEHEGNSPKEVKQQNDQVVNEVFRFLKATGIPDKNYKSEYINLAKNYDYQKKAYHYVANQTLSIHLTDLSNYETLMDGLLETGINRIDNVIFGTTKEDSLQAEARMKAILNAKMKAEEYAGALGQKIGKAVHISEFQNLNVPSPVLRSTVMADGASNKQTMAPGEMIISVRVNVSFELL